MGKRKIKKSLKALRYDEDSHVPGQEKVFCEEEQLGVMGKRNGKYYFSDMRILKTSTFKTAKLRETYIKGTIIQ